MSDPTPVTEAAQPEAAPATEPTQVDSVPDVSSSPDLGDYSFEAALEASLNPTSPSADLSEDTSESQTKEDSIPSDSGSEAERVVQSESTADAREGGEETSATEADLLESLDADVGDDWTPKASAAFQKLKAANKNLTSEREQLVQRAKEAEAKIAELEGTVGNETVETLKSKVEEYEQAQMLSNLESTQAYKDAVIQPLEKVFDGIEKLADQYEVSYQDLVDAVSITDAAEQEEKVSELLATASDRDRATFYRLAADVEPILERRDTLRANVNEALKEADLVAEQRAKQEAADRATERVNVTRNVAQRITDKVPFLSEFEGLDMANISQEAASVDPSVVHPVDFAYQAVAARLMPALVKEYASANKQIETLTAQLATYENAEPKLSSGSESGALASASSKSDSFESAIEKSLGG